MQRKNVYIIIGIAAVILVAVVIMFSYSHRYGYNHMYGPGYGYGMMGPGYGHGMMGPGYGHGMMGPGYGYGMMGNQGYGNSELGLMSSELNLTREQSKQLYDLATNYRLKYYENRGNLEELNKLEQQHRKDIEKILTPAQRKTFEKYGRGFDRYGWYGGCPYH